MIKKKVQKIKVKNLGKRINGVENNLVRKKYNEKNRVQKLSVQKNVGYKPDLGPRWLGLTKIWSKKILVQKNPNPTKLGP